MKPHDGFERLVEAHSPEIFAYLWRLTRDPQDAEDCLQETFLRAYKAYGRLNGAANQRAWLYRVATNTTLTFLTRRRRDQARAEELDPDRTSGGAGLSDVVVMQETLEEVARAVERLPARQRAALVMRKYQELEYPEIAQVLGCSQEAARANVYQALRRLRQEVAL